MVVSPSAPPHPKMVVKVADLWNRRVKLATAAEKALALTRRLCGQGGADITRWRGGSE